MVQKSCKMTEKLKKKYQRKTERSADCKFPGGVGAPATTFAL